jgi:hypothetical protein
LPYLAFEVLRSVCSCKSLLLRKVQRPSGWEAEDSPGPYSMSITLRHVRVISSALVFTEETSTVRALAVGVAGYRGVRFGESGCCVGQTERRGIKECGLTTEGAAMTRTPPYFWSLRS